MQDQGHDKDEDELVQGVEEEVGEEPGAVDEMWSLQTNVQQSQPHGHHSGVLDVIYRPMRPGVANTKGGY